MNIENIDIKDLVLIGGALFTVGVIIHGFWLAWRSRTAPLRLEVLPELRSENDEVDDYWGGELPNGGGRPVEPIQRGLDFDDTPAPVEPVKQPSQTPARRPRVEEASPPPAAAETEMEAQARGRMEERKAGPAVAETEMETEAVDSAHPEAAATPSRWSGASPVMSGGPEADSARSRWSERQAASGSEPDRRRESSRWSEADDEIDPHDDASAASATPTTQDLLVINLFAPDEAPFRGEALLAAMRKRGLKYGEMRIFHRFDPATKAIRFSVANVVEPGHFDMGSVATLVSPGLVFFMQLPGPADPEETVEDMIDIARGIADDLGAVLKDEHMALLTPQRIADYRERAAEYSHRQPARRVGAM